MRASKGIVHRCCFGSCHFFLVFIFCSAFSACHHRIGLEPPQNFRTATGEERGAFEQWLRSEEDIRAIRGLTELELAHGSHRQQFKQIIIFSRPDRLRVEMFATALKQLVTLVVVRGEQLEGYDVSEKKLYRGRLSRENMRKLIAIPLLPEELVLWICGKVPRETELKEVRMSPDGSRTYASLTLGELEFRLLRENNKLQTLSIEEGSSTVLKSDYESQGGSCPTEVRFQIPEHDVQGVIRLINIELNGTPREELFTVKAPSNAKVVELD